MKRKTPLLPGKPLQRKTPMSRSAVTKSAAFGRLAAREHKTVAKLKSRGMAGRAPTADERRFMNDIAGLGCIACHKDGIVNPWISIHHIDGRTKPGAHFRVLPLCAGHHQDGTGVDPSLIAVHPYKARFEERYGTQLDLLAECMAMIGWNAEKEAT